MRKTAPPVRERNPCHTPTLEGALGCGSSRKSSRCLVVFIIGFGLQIRGLPTQAGVGQDHGTRGADLTAPSFALIVAGNILG